MSFKQFSSSLLNCSLVRCLPLEVLTGPSKHLQLSRNSFMVRYAVLKSLLLLPNPKQQSNPFCHDVRCAALPDISSDIGAQSNFQIYWRPQSYQMYVIGVLKSTWPCSKLSIRTVYRQSEAVTAETLRHHRYDRQDLLPHVQKRCC